MTNKPTSVTDQLVEDLSPALEAVAQLLGLDLAELLTLAETRARGILAEVAADPGGAIALATLLWGNGEPPADWWRTPLGLVMAQAVQYDDTTDLTQQHAADILGVARGSVAQMLARGTLARSPRGGVARASVLHRLCRLRPTVDT